MNLFFWCMDSVAYNFSCKRIYCTTPEGFVRSYPAIRDSAAKIRKLRK